MSTKPGTMTALIDRNVVVFWTPWGPGLWDVASQHFAGIRKSWSGTGYEKLYAAGAAGAGGVPNQMCNIVHVWKMTQKWQKLPIFKKIIAQPFYHLFEICKRLKLSTGHEKNYKNFFGCVRAHKMPRSVILRLTDIFCGNFSSACISA